MYLMKNYQGTHSLCNYTNDCKERFDHLNKWLKEKKDLYTYNGACLYNCNLCIEYIDKLWIKLDAKYD